MTPVPVTDDNLWIHVHPASSRRLLLAALEAFAEHGFRAATTRQIAERAGMSPAGVYVHYRSKIDLLFEITQIGHVAVLAAVNAALDGATDPDERLAAFMSAFTSWHARNHTLARVTQYELDALEPEHIERLRELRRSFEQLVDTIVADGVAVGSFEVEDPAATRMALLSIGIDVARWGKGGPRLGPDRLGDAYARLALRMVAAR